MERQSLQRELNAASAIAAQAGLGAVAPQLLHLGNHTTVRLHPWDLVARIASGTSFSFSDTSLGRELAIATHLAARNAPAVRLARALPPGPYFHDGCAITLWEFVDGRPLETEAEEVLAARALTRLHADLAAVAIDLPPFTDKLDSCETILANGEQAPALATNDRNFLQGLHERFHDEVKTVKGRWQPLHGDCHVGNVLITPAGAIWMDLESACSGPVEWDVGFLPREVWSCFPDVDQSLLRLLTDVRTLCVATWCWAEFDRSVATNEAALYHLNNLKRRFG